MFINTRHSTPQSGLTMIELAIVLAIIGLIASTLIPTLTSTVKRGKMSEARSVLYAVRDEIIGYAEAHDNTLPDDLGELGFPADPWGGEIRYLGDNDAKNDDICGDFDSTSLDFVTKDGQTIDDIAFVIASNGPDHSEKVSLGNSTNGEDFEDDLVLYVTLFHLQAVLCDPGEDNPIGLGELELKDFVASFDSISNVNASGAGAVVNSDGTISLGYPVGSDLVDYSYGCIWYGGDLEGVCEGGECDFGEGFRAFFTFTVRMVGSTLADGFTFSVINAESNSHDSCGGKGSALGYSSTSGIGSNSDAGAEPFINAPKIGVEFDFFKSSSSLYNDPNDDHLGIIYWGKDASISMNTDKYRGGDDNKHDIDPGFGDPSVPNYVTLGSNRWFNENGTVEYDVRLEIERSSDQNEDGNYEYVTRVWFDCENCDDVSKSWTESDDDPLLAYNATKYFDDTMEINSTVHSKFDKMMFGWTEGTGSLRQDVTIKEASFYFVGDD